MPPNRRHLQDDSVVLDGAVVAEKLGVSERTLRRLRYDGKIKFLRVGNQVRFLQRHVDEYFAEAERQGMPASRCRPRPGRKAA